MDRLVLHSPAKNKFVLDSIDENCRLREVLFSVIDDHYLLEKSRDGLFAVLHDEFEAKKRMYDYLKKEACEFLERGGYVLEDKIQLDD